MPDAYHQFTERLKALLSENGSSLEIASVQEANCPKVMLEIHAVCHDDPVLRPEDDDELEPGATGPWDRREVKLVVTLPCDTGGCVTANLNFATRDVDNAGDRLVSFHWVFSDAGDPGLAEMKFSDSKTFKLDYFNVLPPAYVRSFVCLCEQAYNETDLDPQTHDPEFLNRLLELSQSMKSNQPGEHEEMDQHIVDRESFMAIVRHWHEGHERPDQVQHCEDVANLLGQALNLDRPAVAARRDMILAALGHDLYEDSTIPQAEILRFGKEVDQLIRAVTEEKDGVGPYVERVASGPEEARLIKLCDGADNYGGLVQKNLVQTNPSKWVRVVRRHMEPMFNRLDAIPFKKYPNAGAWLTKVLAEKREQFWIVVEELLGKLGTDAKKL
jgi:hypothetical protein